MGQPSRPTGVFFLATMSSVITVAVIATMVTVTVTATMTAASASVSLAVCPCSQPPPRPASPVHVPSLARVRDELDQSIGLH